MLKTVLQYYKMSFLVSLTLAIVLVSIRVEKEPSTIGLIGLGVILGTFFLDLDYLIYAFFLEPATEFSINFVGYIKHKDLRNALNYLFYHKHDIQDKTLHSIFFQIVLAGIMIIVASSSPHIFIKALVLSIFLNSLYRLVEAYFDNKLEEWFWALKNKPSRNSVFAYILVLLSVFIYSVSLFA